jgi:hypothetical protein
MNRPLPRIYVDGDEVLLVLDWGNGNSDPFVGVCVNLAGTRKGKLLAGFYWRVRETGARLRKLAVVLHEFCPCDVQ